MKLSNLLISILALLVFTNLHAAPLSVKKKAGKPVEPSASFLSAIKGEVLVNGKPASSGDKIEANATIITKKDGQARLLMGDSMVAAIGNDSQVVLEKFDVKQSDSKVLKTVIKNENAQLHLLKGSLRMMVAKEDNTIRMATIHSGDAFGIVQSGEARFVCDEACVAKLESEKQLQSDLEKLTKTSSKKNR